MPNDFYSTYIEHKSWVGGDDPKHDAIYDRIFQLAPTGRAVSILEIGFGDGQFMRWARKNGHAVEGYELINTLVERARLEGFTAFPIPVLADNHTAKFDVICAFDVIEHLDLDEFVNMLQETRKVLSTNGLYIFRFPNGASPFGRLNQHGDLTHIHSYTLESLSQVLTPLGLRVSSVLDERYLFGSSLAKFKRRLLYFVRGFIESALDKIYYESTGVPLSPNLIVTISSKEIDGESLALRP